MRACCCDVDWGAPALTLCGGLQLLLCVRLATIVKEEIVISKEPVTKQKTVETDLRHEEVDVDRSSGNVRIKEEKTRGGR